VRLLPILVVAGLVLAAPGVSRADTAAVDDDANAEYPDDLTPRDEIGYRRGKRIKIKVVRIGWTDVEVNTAEGFLAMRAAAAADGIELWIYSGFRSHERQQLLYQAWREGWGNKAARPGRSNHQSGRALDLYLGDPSTYDWLKANARKFGFKRTVRGEPWHWEYTKKPKKKKKKKRARKRR
jgi:LAS superfamily LD-carboxypeptidase LdcB